MDPAFDEKKFPLAAALERAGLLDKDDIAMLSTIKRDGTKYTVTGEDGKNYTISGAQLASSLEIMLAWVDNDKLDKKGLEVFNLAVYGQQTKPTDKVELASGQTKITAAAKDAVAFRKFRMSSDNGKPPGDEQAKDLMGMLNEIGDLKGLSLMEMDNMPEGGNYSGAPAPRKVRTLA